MGEELGVKLKDQSEIQFAFSVKARAVGATSRHGSFQDNEIQDVYVLLRECEIAPEDLILQTEEVEGAQYWKWKEYREALQGEDERFVPRSEEYISLFDKCLSNIQSKS